MSAGSPMVKLATSEGGSEVAHVRAGRKQSCAEETASATCSTECPVGSDIQRQKSSLLDDELCGGVFFSDKSASCLEEQIEVSSPYRPRLDFIPCRRGIGGYVTEFADETAGIPESPKRLTSRPSKEVQFGPGRGASILLDRKGVPRVYFTDELLLRLSLEAHHARKRGRHIVAMRRDGTNCLVLSKRIV